jgi:hypothetical protein|nr:MAG TPA_asm: hypothetical protein [Bacteriophage sp.]
MDDKKVKKLYERIRKGENIKEIEGKRVQVYAYTYIYLHKRYTKEMIRALKIWCNTPLTEQKEVEELILKVIEND